MLRNLLPMEICDNERKMFLKRVHKNSPPGDSPRGPKTIVDITWLD